MRQRLYPETIPVLASCWLKTVYSAGHNRAWWRQLDEGLTQALRGQPLDAPSREAVVDIQTWIRQSVLPNAKMPSAAPPQVETHSTKLSPERLSLYISRLLNEWLSAEVACLLVDESESTIPQNGGIPVLAVGRALERHLVRARLSPETLEMLLQSELLSPQYVYPADAEMLVDVVLALLGRTGAPAMPVMPATFLGAANGSPLPKDYEEAVRRASFVEREGREEVHVPIAAAQAQEILKGDPVRIASIIVTMDGRWWESERLESGERHSVVYRPGGRLRIDYSVNHAKLEVPWPDTQLQWPGTVHFRYPFEVFGREWRASSWETDVERSWLHLEFSRMLPIVEIQPANDAGFPRSRPASVDMAWAALENALAISISKKNSEAIEQLRRSDFIPLGRAIFRFGEAVNGRRTNRELIETQLRAVRYLQAQLSLGYGRVPWRILPPPLRAIFLNTGPDDVMRQLLNEVFDGLPESLSEPVRRSPMSEQGGRPTSPSQAA